MKTTRALILSATTLLVLLAAALPAFAAETPDQKSQLITRSPHHVVGAVILAALGVIVLAAIGNAVRQLRGERSQADGRFRWR
jgi:ABC-type uncharacterized transport system fused permease/ATPase subunit